MRLSKDVPDLRKRPNGMVASDQSGFAIFSNGGGCCGLFRISYLMTVAKEFAEFKYMHRFYYGLAFL